MSTKEKKEAGKKRKNIRLPRDLTAWAEQYAKSKNTNFTQLIVDHLTVLRDSENA